MAVNMFTLVKNCVKSLNSSVDLFIVKITQRGKKLRFLNIQVRKTNVSVIRGHICFHLVFMSSCLLSDWRIIYRVLVF